MKHKRQIDQQLQQQRQLQQQKPYSTYIPTPKTTPDMKSYRSINVSPLNLASTPPLPPSSRSYGKRNGNLSNGQNQPEKYLFDNASTLSNAFNHFSLNDENDDLIEEKPVFSKMM